MMSRFYSTVIVLSVAVVLVLCLLVLTPRSEPVGSAMDPVQRTGRLLAVACPIADESSHLPGGLRISAERATVAPGQSISVLSADRWIHDLATGELRFYSGDGPALPERIDDGRDYVAALQGEHTLSWFLVHDVQWHHRTGMSCRLLTPVTLAEAQLHREILDLSRWRVSSAGTSLQDQLFPPAAGLFFRPGSIHPSLGWGEPIVVILTPPEPEIHVGVYSGRGSWEPGVQAIGNFLDHLGIGWSSLDEGDLRAGNVAGEFDVLWFPGGFSAEYRYHAADHQQVRDFVAAGGGFIGICAGAYYASDIMNWQGGSSDYPLNLFAGRAAGPIRGLGWGNLTSIELESEHRINHGFDPVLDMYYMDGPYFIPDESQPVEVLARYGINDEPAVVSFEYGEGTVLLMGPHPELGRDGEAAAFDVWGGDGAQWGWLETVFRSLFLR